MTAMDIPDLEALADPFDVADDLPPAASAAEQDGSQRTRERRKGRNALFALGAGALLGLFGTVVFYETFIGINAFLFFSACALVLLLGARQTHAVFHRINLLLFAPVLIIALMAAIWLNESLTTWNLLALFGTGALALFYLAKPHTFLRDGIGSYIAAALEVSISVIAVPLISLSAAVGVVLNFSRHGGMAQEAAWRKPVFAALRGLLIAAPIVIVFAILLASADAVFDNFLVSLSHLFELRFSPDLFAQLSMAGVISWFAAGGLAYALAPRDLPDVHAQARAEKNKPKRRVWIGSIEAITVLACVVALFAVFVVIQFAYFFGGQVNLETMTYAEYARRGFFELVAVSVLTLGLLLWLDAVSARPSPRTTLVFRILATALVALTSVMLISAAGRMSLYEQAYGFTHLRISTQVFMGWLGVLFVVYLVSLFRPRGAARIFAPGLLGVAFGYLLTLNVINMDSIIARENLRRFEQGQELDFYYLNTLSLDAAPDIAAFWARTDDARAKEDAGMWLANHAVEYRDSVQTLFSANVSRANGLYLIARLARQLPPADVRYIPNYQPIYSDEDSSYR